MLPCLMFTLNIEGLSPQSDTRSGGLQPAIRPVALPSLQTPSPLHGTQPSRIVFAFNSLPATTNSLPASIPFRITFFAHPHPLTLIESYSCKKQGRGWVTHGLRPAAQTRPRSPVPPRPPLHKINALPTLSESTLPQLLIPLHFNSFISNVYEKPQGGGPTGHTFCRSLAKSAQASARARSRPPVQGHRPIHRMHHRCTRSPCFQQVGLQPEIPLRRPVRIVNQHQPRIVLQSLRLLDHRLLVLPQKFFRKHPENPNRQEQIPRRHKINPAQIAPHRRHRRPARKPQLAAANLFRPDIWQNKVDRRRHRLARIFFQHPVRRAVRARRMRAHPESVGNRLELFFFLVNAMPAPPVP